jgi:hypothetical protein
MATAMVIRVRRNGERAMRRGEAREVRVMVISVAARRQAACAGIARVGRSSGEWKGRSMV